MSERCRLFATLWINDPEFKRHANMNGGFRACERDIQTHHIWGGKTRLNLPSNLIRLCAVSHDWMHMRPVEGRIACLWRQADLGVLNWAELDQCAGFSVRGWVENQTPRKEYEWQRRELLNWTSPTPPASTATGGTTGGERT